MSFALVVRFTTKPGAEERTAEILSGLMGPSQAEPGIDAYLAYRDPEDRRVFVMYEAYRDRGALEEHRATPHFQSVGEELVGLMDSIEKTELEPLGS
ncbi:MAG: antibiotic biosynthesis monooxygenase [Actinobacteria bacterium]|nr:antibiotic biosynthesis monooxygenase [Actinomycetota bacterium]